MVSESEPIIILDIKSAVFMSKNIKDTKQTRNIFRGMQLVKMVKSTISTKKCGVRDVFSWHILKPKMLGRLN